MTHVAGISSLNFFFFGGGNAIDVPSNPNFGGTRPPCPWWIDARVQNLAREAYSGHWGGQECPPLQGVFPAR